jgi:hypothetical protein
MVKSVFLRVMFSPHLWLGAAAISIAASFVVDYVDAQRTADRALALRQGPPPLAMLQEFDPARHTGPAREVLILAEADLATPIIVKLGPGDDQRAAVIYPLFPVSEPGQEIVARQATVQAAGGGSDSRLAAIRPIPRPDAEAIYAEPPTALGVILHWADDADASNIDPVALVARSFGPGSYGSVIEVNGERVAPGDMALVVQGAMAAKNLTIDPDFLAVAPFANGRVAALSPPPSSGLQRALLWGGMALGLGALLLSVRTVEVFTPRADTPKRPGQQDRRVSTGITPKARSRFQTIPTQDEIYAANQVQQSRGEESGTGRKAAGPIEKIRTRR